VLGLAEKEHWKQMHMVVVEFRKHHEAPALADFASGLSVEQVLKSEHLQKSEDLLVEITENMLDSGAVLHSGYYKEQRSISVLPETGTREVLHTFSLTNESTRTF
jgi:hypothetical protein